MDPSGAEGGEWKENYYKRKKERKKERKKVNKGDRETYGKVTNQKEVKAKKKEFEILKIPIPGLPNPLLLVSASLVAKIHFYMIRP